MKVSPLNLGLAAATLLGGVVLTWIGAYQALSHSKDPRGKPRGI